VNSNRTYSGHNYPILLTMPEKKEEFIPKLRVKKKSNATSVLFWEQLSPQKLKLYNFIHKSLNFSEEADDVFQETVLRALKYFKSYKKELSFGTWLFSIAHNEIKRHFKKVGKVPTFNDVESRGISSTKQQDLVKDIYLYAESLKPRHREVFFLFYYSGFTISEISRIIHLKEGSIKAFLNQARNTLREMLGENNV